MSPVLRQTFWQAPSGRIHSLKRCTGAAPVAMMSAVRLSLEQFTQADVCRCATWSIDSAAGPAATPGRSPLRDGLASAISASLADFRGSGKSGRRHPAEVTSDRLGDALDRWPDRFDGGQRDAIADLRHTLEQIAEDAR